MKDHDAIVGPPGAITDTVGAPAATARTLRLSGAGDAPTQRGWLHLAAFVLAVPAGTALVVRGGFQATLVLYALSLLALFGVSSAYHLIPTSERTRQIMRRVDHAVIYVYIAGAFTPFCLRVAPGTEGHVVLILAWIGAAAGVTLKVVSFERSRVLASALYLLLGWLTVAVLPGALRRLDVSQFVLLIVMGALYTVGALVLAVRRPDPAPAIFGYHEVWHSMVILAGACYYLVLWSLTGHAGG